MNCLVSDELRYAIFVQQKIVFIWIVFVGLLNQLIFIWFFQICLLNAVKVFNYIFKETIVLIKYPIFVIFFKLSLMRVAFETFPDKYFINFDTFVELKYKFQSLESGLLFISL